MTDDKDTTVYRRTHSTGNNPTHYHADRDCMHIKDSHVIETTQRKARTHGYPACGDCVGRYCPRCESRVPGRIKSHLQGCEG